LLQISAKTGLKQEKSLKKRKAMGFKNNPEGEGVIKMTGVTLLHVWDV
jgi:hypothetical protein